MYCKDCHYELRGLQAGCCPECGRAFDPGDASSYVQRGELMRTRWLSRLLGRGILACGCVPLLANLYGLLMLLVARVSLGRWPDMRGSESPDGIPGARVLAELIGILFLGSFFAPIAILALVVTLWIEDRAWRRSVQCGLIAAGLWVAGAALFWWDPLLVWNWIFD